MQQNAPVNRAHPLSERQATLLLISAFIVSICGILYELIISTLSSYLLGNSVAHFSITIGLFLSAMGIGAYLSQRIHKTVLAWFMLIELSIGLVGGLAAALLYAVFAFGDYYYTAMTLLILVLGALIGMEVPLITRIISAQGSLADTLKESLANVLAFDYLGALLASLLFPLLLLPQFGLVVTSFATGLLNLLITALLVWVFRDLLIVWRPLLLLNALFAAILLVGIWMAQPMTAFLERQLYDDPILYTKQTPYQRIIFTRWGNDLRLFLDGNLQFSAMDEYRYHETLVHPAMSQSRWLEAVLVLGGGDGLVVREVLKYNDVQEVVLVDIDPTMTELANNFAPLRSLNQGSLTDLRVRLVHQDAFTYLTTTDERFGVIILDLPDPNNESLGKLYSREFYELVRKRLGKGGIIVTQATSPYFARQAFWNIAHTMQEAGLQIVPYHVYVPSFGDWGFVLAAEHRVDLTTFAPTVPLRFLTPALLAATQHFDADMSELPTAISTLNNQLVVRDYEKGWRQWR